MSGLPSIILNSTLWKTTLAEREDDDHAVARGRLRNEFIQFREKTDLLASEISKDLPDLTVHDITHIDALWETGSLVVGEDYKLTPTEGFVLGGAFLLHDLALSLASLEDGINTLKNDESWDDLVTIEYRDKHDRDPSPNEIKDPEEPIRKYVTSVLLRRYHAENAEKLAFLSLKSGNANDAQFLINDVEIRQYFGRIMGLIAHSHWWSIDIIESKFGHNQGAPHWCPLDWVIDPLKIACILRLADATHIDAKRAPFFLRAIKDPKGIPADHWGFQEKMNKPYLAEDSLTYSTGPAFPLEEANSWWLCFETLKGIDRELRLVDSLLADKGYLRFAARRVAGIDSPERLVSYIQADGWLPVDATLHVSDLPRIIDSLGGEELYGKNPEVAVRELIQNSADAVRARRLYENREHKYGAIRVALLKDSDDSYWLEVSDDGVGMSERVLTEYLLDFGSKFWGSALMQEEFPGLLATGIKPVGKYGIGFFTVFMLSDEIHVITRRADQAVDDTLVLEFNSGVSARPILRKAFKHEYIRDGGTTVKLKLKSDPYKRNGLLYISLMNERQELSRLCRELCPALDVDLYVNENGEEEKVVSAYDWIDMPGEELLERLSSSHMMEEVEEEKVEQLRRLAANLRLIRDEAGEIIGRVCVSVGFALRDQLTPGMQGVVTVGGLKACGLSGIIGVLAGKPDRISRDSAIPLATGPNMIEWANEQADLVPYLYESGEKQAACAQLIRLCGGETRDLPICTKNGKWLSANGVAALSSLPDEIILIDHSAIDDELRFLENVELNDNVFMTTALGGIPRFLQSGRHSIWPINMDPLWGNRSIRYNLVSTLVEAISTNWGVSIEELMKTNSLESKWEIAVGRANKSEIKTWGILVKKPSGQDGQEIHEPS